MKNSHLIGAVCASIFSFISLPSHAALVDNGGGLIYDDVLDITWAQPDAERTWDDANTWAAGLTLGGVSGWRLPYISVAEGAGPFTGSPVDCNTATEAACQDNELGYMFYHNLSGTLEQSILTSGDPDLALFPTLQAGFFIDGRYWSGTEFDSGCCLAWTFNFGRGVQGNEIKEFSPFSWAVHAGNVVPLIDNGYTTITPASGLEWLDLTYTQGVSAQDVLAGFGGYIDAGWTFATAEQVCGLLGALGDDTTDCTTGAVAVPMDPTNAETFVNLLGYTAAAGRGAYGMFNNIDSFPDNFGIGCINDTATSCTMGGASSWLTQIEWASGYTTVGSFLVREYIEPVNTLIDNGYTTIDTASGLEWLDLTFTQGVSAQDVLAGFGDYIYDGWNFATAEQVCGLFGALGDDTTDCTTGAVAMQMNPSKSETLVNLLGSTAGAGRGAYGMFNNIASFPDNFGIGCINDTATSCTMGGASSWLTQIEWASGYTTVGSFLVRDFIEPPPTTLIDNGDTTIDTASGLEWLDLTFTQGVSTQDVLDGFGDFIFVGWAFAEIEQVCGLFGALGDDTTNCTTGAVAVQMNPSKSETLVNLLGNTAASGRGAYGMFNNLGGFAGNFGLGCINDTATSCTGGGASSWLTQIEWGGGYETVGSYLIRDYIEPPPTVIETWSSRALFEADNPGFVIEDFEEANIEAEDLVVIPGPLDATSSNSYFAPGDIAAGLVINEYPDSTPGVLQVYGNGFRCDEGLPGVSSTQITLDNNNLQLHLMFAAGVQSVGFDVFNVEANREIVAHVYSEATLLDTITVRGSGTGTGFFLGVASDDAITRVSLEPSDRSIFTVDNVTFNSVSGVCPCNGLTAGDVTWDLAFPATDGWIQGGIIEVSTGDLNPEGELRRLVTYPNEIYGYLCQILQTKQVMPLDHVLLLAITPVQYDACYLELQEIFDSIP